MYTVAGVVDVEDEPNTPYYTLYYTLFNKSELNSEHEI